MPSIVLIDELNDTIPTMLVDAIRCNVAIACVCDVVDCFAYCHYIIEPMLSTTVKLPLISLNLRASFSS